METSDKSLNDFQVVTSLQDLDIKEETIETGNKDEVERDERADAYYELLKDEGMITVAEDYKFDGTFKGLKKIQEDTFQQQYQVAQDQLLAQMPDRLRDVVQAGLNGVSDIDTLLNITKDLEFKIDLTNEAAQKNLIRRELSGTIAEEDLDELIEMYSDKGKLKTEAEKILGRKQEQASQRIQQMQQEAFNQKQQQDQYIQEFNKNLTSEIESQQWNNTRKQTVMNEIAGTYQGQPLIEAKLNAILSDHKNVVALADFLSYFDGSKFNLDDYKKISSQEAKNIKDRWASALSDTPVTLKQREQQNRGSINLDDFELYPG